MSIAGYYVVILAFPKYPVLTGVVNTVGGFSLIIFTNVFCYQMLKVNKQFGIFFKQINDESYPYRTVKVVFISYYVVSMIVNSIRLVYYYVGIHVYIGMLCVIVISNFESFFFIMQTLALLYLADVYHQDKHKINKDRQKKSEKVSISIALNDSNIHRDTNSSTLLNY